MRTTVSRPSRRTPQALTLTQILAEKEGERTLFTTAPIELSKAARPGCSRNSYFVLGDNRIQRRQPHLGFVPRELVVGRAMFIYWSYDESAPTTEIH